MENETLKFIENGNNANLLLSAGLPSEIWHKKWSEKFNMQEEGTKVGYVRWLCVRVGLLTTKVKLKDER